MEIVMMQNENGFYAIVPIESIHWNISPPSTFFLLLVMQKGNGSYVI